MNVLNYLATTTHTHPLDWDYVNDGDIERFHRELLVNKHSHLIAEVDVDDNCEVVDCVVHEF